MGENPYCFFFRLLRTVKPLRTVRLLRTTFEIQILRNNENLAFLFEHRIYLLFIERTFFKTLACI